MGVVLVVAENCYLYTGGYCPYRHLYTLYISKLTSRKMVIDSLEENLDFSNAYLNYMELCQNYLPYPVLKLMQRDQLLKTEISRYM